MTRCRGIIVIVVLLCMVMAGIAHAQGETPPRAAEALRQQLFNAQSALLSGDSAAAVEAVQAASAIYETTLLTPLREWKAANADNLSTLFSDAQAAAEAGDSLKLAETRGQIWTMLLGSAAETAINATLAGDTATAQSWLLLREFRPSTRFSRPGADATIALQQLIAGNVSAEDASETIRIDLLDTYQAQLNASLAGADEATNRDFAMRRAEEAGLAAGYFAILAPDYGTQRGDEGLADAQTAFQTLMEAARADQTPAFETARTAVDELLKGFRAAPLSEAELARRAGQLLRFIALVPVEYERGVRDGVVTNDIEIQEALTFREGAATAFADLSATLHAMDAKTTAQVGDLLDTVKLQIQDVAEPGALRANVDQINQLLSGLLPAEWQNSNADSDVDVILSVLDQVGTAVAQKQYAQAESARLEAYALLELGIEQRLRGFAPEMAVRIESLFWQGTGEIRGLADLIGTGAPASEIKATLNELNVAFAEAQTLLSAGKAAPAAVAGNAAVIVFREGLEAVLILASLLASLRSVEERIFRRPLLIGAGLAFLATVITWWVAGQLLSSLMQYGERLEAVVSLIAIGVLLLITNWFFHKVYWTGWMANFHTRKRRLVGGIAVVTISQSVGLIILGFTSIYREGFETVLFLQSLVLEAGSSVVLQGIALGLFGTAIVGAITFALQVRLPYKKMLIVTGVMIGFVLLTMVGHTVHVMQSVGWLPITPINGLFLPYWVGQWFGLFATWQGIGLQIVAGVFVIGSYFWAENINKRKRSQSSKNRSTNASEAALETGAGD